MSQRVKYTQVKDGDRIRPTPQQGHRMRCCDCGLIHVVDFYVRSVKGKRIVEFVARRDNRATANARRAKR